MHLTTRATIFLVCCLCTSSLANGTSPVEVPLPTPTETFNLYFNLVKAEKTEAALGLVHSAVVDDRMREVHTEMATMISKHNLKLQAYKEIIEDDMAVAFLLVERSRDNRIDIDPCYFVRQGEVWYLLPLNIPMPPLDLAFLTDSQRQTLSELKSQFRAQESKDKKRIEKRVND